MISWLRIASGPCGKHFCAEARCAGCARISSTAASSAGTRWELSRRNAMYIIWCCGCSAMYGEEDKKLFGRSGRSEFFSALSRTTMQQKNKPPGGFVDSRSASSLYSTAHKLERHVESRTPAVQKKPPSLEFLGDWRIDWVIGEFGVMFRCDKNIRIASGGIWLS